MKSTKPSHFKQSCPKDQLTTLIMALEGGLSNLQEGIPTNIDGLLQRVEDLKALQLYMLPSWEAMPTSSYRFPEQTDQSRE